MKKDTFLEELLEWMEIEPVDINEDTVFRELKDFDSMSVMSIVAYSNEKFGKTLSAEQLQKMNTVRDLMDLIGIDFFD
jgi:acyl carrier protein